MATVSPSEFAGRFEDSRLRNKNRIRFKEEISQAVFNLMTAQGVSKAELARLLSKRKSQISKMLEGSHNFTLETLADVFMVLGRSSHLALDTIVDDVSDSTDYCQGQWIKPVKFKSINVTGNDNYTLLGDSHEFNTEFKNVGLKFTGNKTPVACGNGNAA